MKLKNLAKKAWKRQLLLVLLVSAIIWAAFPPLFYANVDEHNFLRSAWKISNFENLEEEDSTQSLGGFLNEEELFVSKYNLGNSLWYAPALAIGWQAAFVVSLLTLFALISTCWYILKELNLDKQWIWLIALFPPFIYFSRTVLSELPAALMVTLSYLAYLKLRQSNWWPLVLGISLGMAVLMRYNLALWAILILIDIGWQFAKNDKKHWRTVATVLIGGIPFLLSLIFVNLELYNGAISSGYSLSGEQSISLEQISERLPAYLLMLNLLYPLQFFLTPLSKKPLALAITIFNIITVIIYSVAGGFLFEWQLTDAIVGVRFFIPILPLVIIHYFAAIERYSKSHSQINYRRQATLLAISLLIFTNLALSYTHQRFTEERRRIYENIMQLEMKNSLFIGSEEDYIYLGEHLHPNFNQAGYVDVEVFNSSKDHSDWGDIYLLVINYSSRDDRPTTDVLEFLRDQQIDNNVDEIVNTDNISIYHLEN